MKEPPTLLITIRATSNPGVTSGTVISVKRYAPLTSADPLETLNTLSAAEASAAVLGWLESFEPIGSRAENPRET